MRSATLASLALVVLKRSEWTMSRAGWLREIGAAVTFGTCEHAARIRSTCATEVPGLKLTSTYRWDSAASIFAQSASVSRASPAVADTRINAGSTGAGCRGISRMRGKL